MAASLLRNRHEPVHVRAPCAVRMRYARAFVRRAFVRACTVRACARARCAHECARACERVRAGPISICRRRSPLRCIASPRQAVTVVRVRRRPRDAVSRPGCATLPVPVVQGEAAPPRACARARPSHCRAERADDRSATLTAVRCMPALQAYPRTPHAAPHACALHRTLCVALRVLRPHRTSAGRAGSARRASTSAIARPCAAKPALNA